jgi:hypothetical protein
MKIHLTLEYEDEDLKALAAYNQQKRITREDLRDWAYATLRATMEEVKFEYENGGTIKDLDSDD